MGNEDAKRRTEEVSVYNTHFDRIYLKFGNGCNFDCKYCSQGESDRCFQNEPSKGCTLSQEVIDWLDHYVAEINDPKKPTYIVLWGGEPLLYFDSIKFVVERYGKAFNYGTATNGTYLTEEIVEFFNKHEIRLALSHDGGITEETRGVDVLKNKRIKDLYAKINKGAFFSVVTSKNCSISAIYDFFADKGLPDIDVDVFYCLDTNGKPDTLTYTDFDLDKFDAGWKELLRRNDAYLNGDTRYFREHRIVDGNIQGLKEKLLHPVKKGKFFCETCGIASQGTKINVLWDGRLTACHNSNVVIGHITDDYSVVKQNRREYEDQHESHVDCSSCEFDPICKGVCAHTTEHGAKTWCDLQKVSLSNLLLYIQEKAKKNG